MARRARISTLSVALALTLSTLAAPATASADSTPIAALDATVDCGSGDSLTTAIGAATVNDTLTVLGVCNEEIAVPIDLTIVGGSPDAAISGVGIVLTSTALVTVDAGATLTLNDIRVGDADGRGILVKGELLADGIEVSGNDSPLSGAGIKFLGAGKATIQRSTISGNLSGGNGGGIEMQLGTPNTLINRTTISDNTAAGQGGGVVASPNLDIIRSTISGNTSSGNGGGLLGRTGPGQADLIRSTVSGNTSTTGRGGGVAGDVRLREATVTDNTADRAGGAFGTVQIGFSIVAGNMANAGADCSGTISAFEKSVVGLACWGAGPANELTKVGNPGLEPLADNGGPTLTHTLTRKSKARDFSSCSGFATIDQRGVPREGICDAGSVEADPVPVDRTCDFDGDGYEDAAIGAPLTDVVGKIDAGAVYVTYGSANGLDSARQLVLTQGSPGVPGVPQIKDFFGQAVACGDFDEDGYGDLVVGAPGQDRPSLPDSGTVHLVFGSPDGLSETRFRTLIPPNPVRRGLFGSAFAVGRFQSNTTPTQLAVGIPELQEGGGRIALYMPTVNRNAFMTLGTSKVNGTDIGGALAAGDFDGDGDDDIVSRVGNPSQFKGGGVVWFDGPFFPPEPRGGEPVFGSNTSKKGSAYGSSIASGDFDGDGIFDLAVGIPGNAGGEGAIDVFMSSNGSPLSTRTTLSPGDFGATGASLDNLGFSVDVADLNGDGLDDIVAGIPGLDDGATDAGGLTAALSDGDGTFTALAYTSAATPGIPGNPGDDDALGSAIAMIDADGDGRVDVLAGAPGTTVGDWIGAGTILYIRGAPAGFAGGNNGIRTPDDFGGEFTSQEFGRFGAGLTRS